MLSCRVLVFAGLEIALPQARSPRDFMTDDEVKRLIKSLDKSVFHEYRDLLVALLMLDCGMRLGETLSIEMRQVNMMERSILLPADKTKGRKERQVYFAQKTAVELRRWMQYKDRYCESTSLFPVRHGSPDRDCFLVSLGWLFAQATIDRPVSSAVQIPWSADRRESVCGSISFSASDTFSLLRLASNRLPAIPFQFSADCSRTSSKRAADFSDSFPFR